MALSLHRSVIAGFMALLLNACAGSVQEQVRSNPAERTIVTTATTAELAGQISCSSVCTFEFRYWKIGSSSAWGRREPALAVGSTPANGASGRFVQTVTDLQPDTTYEFALCALATDAEHPRCRDQGAFITQPSAEIIDFTASLSDVNVITLRWETQGGLAKEPVHIYGAFHDPIDGSAHRNVGFRDQHTNRDGLAFRVGPGLHRYVLEVPTPSGPVTKTIEVDVPFPAAPVVESPDHALHPKRITGITTRWEPLDDQHFMMIRRTGVPVRVFGRNTYTFYTTTLNQILEPGNNKIIYTACVDMADRKPPMDRDFCGHPALTYFIVGSASFLVPKRLFARTGDSVTLSWTDSSDRTKLTAPAELGGERLVQGYRYTFTNLPEGIHNIMLESCVGTPMDCANSEPIQTPVAGTFRERVSLLETVELLGEIEGLEVAEIVPDDGGDPVPIVAPINGYFRAPVEVADGDRVSAGQTLRVIEHAPLPFVQIVVEDAGFELKPWSEDYQIDADAGAHHAIPVTSHVRPGYPLGLLVTQDGDVWNTGEFADGSLTQISRHNDNRLTTLAAPLHLTPVPEENAARLEPVRPFMQPRLNGLSLTKQETLVEVGPYIYFVNGGSSHANDDDPAEQNWNRIIRFDRTGKNNSSTVNDDRFCVYHIPRENAGVMGLQWDEAEERLWYVESRHTLTGSSPDSERVSRLAWFSPDELTCENFIDYQNPSSLARTTSRYCSSEAERGCIHSVALRDSIDGRKLIGAGHIAVDSDAVWVAGYYNSSLARYDRRSRAVDIITTNPSSQGGSQTEAAKLLGSGPWKIVTSNDYVYFSEYFDGDVVRLDKQALAATPDLCKDPGPGRANPCLDEIHAARRIKDIQLQGNRLYFSGRVAFGYINVDSWTPGVIYTGIEQLRHPQLKHLGPLISGDMAIGDDGMVVLNDYRSNSILRLYPKSQPSTAAAN
ncbi:MAG: hypothetical protein AAGA91_07805 [Pseudomonadota bacterium]